MFNSVSEYEKSRHQTILTERELKIPGLRMIGRLNMPAAARPLEMHIHQSCMEFVVMLKGKQTYFAGGEHYILSGGDVYTSFLDQPHGSGGGLQDICEIIWFQLDMRGPRGFLGLGGPFAKRLYEKLLGWDAAICKSDPVDRRVIKDAFSCFAKETPESAYLGAGLLVQFLNRILFRQKPAAAAADSLAAVLRYIDANVESKLGMAELARLCGLSQSHFKHKFAESTGMTPRYYVNLKKIEKAGELLKNPGTAVVDAAFGLGFESSSYFSVVFKKYTGMTPTQYAAAARTIDKPQRS